MEVTGTRATARLEHTNTGRTARLGLARVAEFPGRRRGPFLLAEAGRRLAAHIIAGNAARRRAFTRAAFTCVGAALHGWVGRTGCVN